MDFQMLVVQGKARGQFLRFPCGEFIFGRGPECHVRPNSDWVSRQHCLLRVTEDAMLIRDLGSTNGTLVNGSRVTGEIELHAGDQLQVGPLVLQVVVNGQTERSPDSPAAAPLADTRVWTQDTSEEIRAFQGPAPVVNEDSSIPEPQNSAG
jgi:predicted component of type VI protein secretion system